MKVALVQLLTMTAALAAPLGAADWAVATDAPLAPAPSLALTNGVMAAGLPALAPEASADGAPAAPPLRRWFTETRLPSDCTKRCGIDNDGSLMAEQLLAKLGADPVLGTVMAPVTRGVPISTGDGGPALQLAVIPTQITRGSGLVAIGHF